MEIVLVDAKLAPRNEHPLSSTTKSSTTRLAVLRTSSSPCFRWWWSRIRGRVMHLTKECTPIEFVVCKVFAPKEWVNYLVEEVILLKVVVSIASISHDLSLCRSFSSKYNTWKVFIIRYSLSP